MKLDVKINGLDALRAKLAGQQKQVAFAAAKALTQTAHAVNAEIKAEMKTAIAGGPTPYTLRAFQVTAARKDNLEAKVGLRSDGPDGGTPYNKALQHLFTGGRRDWKRLEGWLRGKGLLPAGMMVVPGPKAPLDARGNFRRAALKEMLHVLGSETRNTIISRQSGTRSKRGKEIGFFVCRPGDRSGLTPGIWRRISSRNVSEWYQPSHGPKAKKLGSSTVEPWIMYISPTSYRKKFDLDTIAKKVVTASWQKNFSAALEDAMRTAK